VLTFITTLTNTVLSAKEVTQQTCKERTS